MEDSRLAIDARETKIPELKRARRGNLGDYARPNGDSLRLRGPVHQLWLSTQV